ncbi:transcriptional regulator, MarR family with acetyltransferase activity [Oceanospirillum multiglobuliferum]|nr:bifunctional helix-turn-helix transcriptional regulator/GNAT family N-acetyltransferase [Oceanospirillum multiglobuliferum]SJZ93211.1 transcriptional regulator, MarR family with acetyltransferase activity [Oceanospirillum multiglobuliferum]
MTNKQDQMQSFGSLSLGSRLKRLSDRMMQEVSNLYQAQGIPLNPSFFPLLNLLLKQGALTVTEAAEGLGISHPAVSKIARKMLDEGWLIKKPDPQDVRRQQLFLTDQSHQLLEQIQPVWREIKTYLDELMAMQTHPLLSAIDEFEQLINTQGFTQPILQRLQTRTQLDQVNIIGWQPELKSHFQRLNMAWLNQYFAGELVEADHLALDHPESYYLAKGGYIWFAELPEQSPSDDKRKIVGCVALARHSADCFEISKMGVEDEVQGLGVGRKLLLAALDKARELGAKAVYLESATQLTRALQLYQNMGFIEVPHPNGVSIYPRSDIYMTLTL